MQRVRSSDAALVLLVGIFFLSIYLLSGSSDLLHNGDTDLRYQTTQAIVDHNRLWIDHPLYSDSRVQVGRANHLYAFYAPGQSLLMAPLYVVGKAIAHHLSLPYGLTTLYASRSLDLILGALLAVAFFLCGRELGFLRRTAVLLTFIFGLATSAWPDAQSALEQTQVNLFILVAVFCLLRWQAASGRRAWLMSAGLAAGSAVLTRYDALLLLAPLAGFVGYVRLRKREARRLGIDVAVLTVALAPWIAAVLAWNDLRFGSVFETGLHEATFGNPPWAGLAALTISPGKGLLWYVPVVALTPWTIRPFARRREGILLLFASLVAIPLLFYPWLIYWHGDPAWGPRYLFVAIPYLLLPMGEILERWHTTSSQLRVALVALVMASVAVQVAAVSVSQWRFWYRLEAREEQTANKFRWGAPYYHYYWQPRNSPIFVQLDNVYQVVRLTALGDEKYRLSARPTAVTAQRHISNPADLYPVNTLDFWWADVRHPLLGPRQRELIAATLALGAIASLICLAALLRVRQVAVLPVDRDSEFAEYLESAL